MEIGIGDWVWFLSDYDLILAQVLSLGKKSIKIKVSPYKGCIAYVKYAKPEKIIHAEQPFCVVWDTSKGRNGRGSYRIERVMYPEKHTVGFKSTLDYVMEK